MSTPRPLHQLQPDNEPGALQARAIDNLRFIRDTMERATAFTAVPGRGLVIIGVSAVATALLASHVESTIQWLGLWIGEALLAFAIALWAMARKARAVGMSLLSGPGRRFGFNLTPPLCAGALLTIALYNNGAINTIPGMWLLLYGAGVATAGTYSVRVVPVMGIAVMSVGAVALAVPAAAHNWCMAAGFGLTHIIFGAIIARRYGG